MFETFSHAFLQEYWWAIISILGGILVFLLFVQGGQSLMYSIGKNELQRTMIVNALGRKWEFTFTTLVTFGGAMFAAFPLFYSTSFGGAYWLWMLVLSTFILQAVSYEYRSKASNFLGKRTFEWFLFLNGFVGTVSLGVAVATFFTGGAFMHDDMNFVTWVSSSHGIEALANPVNLLLGIAVFFLARTLALLYFLNAIDDAEIRTKSKKMLLINAPVFVVFFLAFMFSVWFSEGYAVMTDGTVIMEKYKYINNFLEMPMLAVLFVIGVLLVLWGIIRALFWFEKCAEKGIWFSGIGTVLTVIALLMSVGYNNTAFYPSDVSIQDSLTLSNASSSMFTLTVMSYVSLLVPFVLVYIWIAWRSINNKKIDKAEMEDGGTHVY